MDYIELANAALEKRARAFAELRAVQGDATLTDAARDERSERINTDIATLGREAEGHIRSAEQEVEHRELNARAANLAGNRDQRGQGRDESAELRSLALGKVSEVNFDLRTATTGTAGNAGNTKQTTFVSQVLEAMRNRSQFFGRARLMTTAGGEVMEWPIKNALNPATAPVSGAALVSESPGTYPKGDQAWTKTNIGAYKYGVIVEATQEIVTDSALPILSILAADAGEAVADAVVADLLLGNGTNKPAGWSFRAATSGVNAANLAGITFANLLDLQYSLTAPYRRNGVYMFNDAAVPVLSKIVDGTGNYMWRPSVQAGEPDTIWGKPVLTDPNLPIVGASAKAVLFGDPSKYLIRQVNGLKVTRSDEYGYDRDVVAFKVMWRGSGDLFDLNSVKALTVTA
ncbi:phage major capsid protein [Micromonospora coerulea]|uniref:phage major capsid protein n=1 Tax=Micromonospora coerulea TaxID=47856 RepID=UPI001903A1DA|nr:phage major capsid protein [Micromonospora veneta]